MSSLEKTVTKNIEGLYRLDKQFVFAAAAALTAVTKDAQKQVISNLFRIFRVRSDWWKPGRKFGINATFATRYDLETSLRTSADWLLPHETGGDKTPSHSGSQFGDGSAHLTIPVDANVRPTEFSIIPQELKPKFLLSGGKKLRKSKKRTEVPGKAFKIETTKNGEKITLIFLRTGKGPNDLKLLWSFKERVHIKRESPMIDVATATVQNNFASTFLTWFEKAIKTARNE